MANKHKYLAKNVGLFSISSFVPRILSFVLIPIYTNCLTTAEYGISDLLTTTVSLLLPFFSLDIQDAVMRFSLDKKYEKTDVFTTALRIIFIGTGLVCVGAFIASTLKIPGLENSYLFFFVIMYFTTALSNSLTMFCRGIDKVNILVVGGILQSVIMLTANILFLVVFKWGLTGYLLANTLGSLVAVFWYFIKAKLHKYITNTVSKNVLKDMVCFSFPLIFSVTAWWINSASDRYILTWMSGVAISGLYAVAYKIPGILSVFQSVFYQAWSISAVKEFDKDDKDRFISNMYNMMNFGMVFVCSCIIVLNIPIAKILYTNDFFNAYKFVPPLLISVVFNAMALFIGSIFTAVKDTKTLSVSTIIGAVINTICNFVFIYYWQAYGAALATMIGYGVVFVMRHIILRKHIKLHLNWWRDILVYAALIAQMSCVYSLEIFSLLQLFFPVLILLFYLKEVKQIYIKIKGLAKR
ncbi:MAG: oligosaccharide flippase family protein [Clostridia bacterium]|nr:oligosaccharide flippase family protein [Clostridia bacterium]